MRRILLALILCLPWPPVTAATLTLDPLRVADGVYAVIGDLGNQSYENEGLNANLGFVIGEDAVLVVNTGPTRRVAEALHAAIRRVTDKPVKWVVNVNSQNHYWHGNGYFQDQGATIIAQRKALRLMREQGPDQIESNRRTLRERSTGTALVYPGETFTDSKTILLGTTRVELRHFGNAHTPGDLVVWLPASRVAFAGDLGFTGRLLAVLPFGSSAGWAAALEQLAALGAGKLVPGHGPPGVLTDIERDTRDYLLFLRAAARRVFDGGGSLQDAVDGVDQSAFRRLQNYDLLARRNMNLVFQEIEREAF